MHAQKSIAWSRMTTGDIKNEADAASLAPLALYAVMFLFKELEKINLSAAPTLTTAFIKAEKETLNLPRMLLSKCWKRKT